MLMKLSRSRAHCLGNVTNLVHKTTHFYFVGIAGLSINLFASLPCHHIAKLFSKRT